MKHKHQLRGVDSIGKGQPCFIIGEVAQAHDGSLGLAHSYIDGVARAGADAIKFQTHIAAAESTPGEPFRIKFSYQDETRYDYWRRMEFSEDQWRGLATHAADVGLTFLSSAFSPEALNMLDRVGVSAWKVGSGETNNPQILSAMAATGKPVLLSSGMSDWADLEQALQTVQQLGNTVALMQCTSLYPTPLSDVGLNIIEEMRRRFDVPVGLSDHSGSIFPSLAALARGIDLLEVHVVFSREMFGPDTIASVTIDELETIVQARNAFHEIDSHPVNKDAMSVRLQEVRQVFNKSVALRASQTQGTVLTDDMLTAKKPATGIPVSQSGECVGRRLKHDVPNDRVLTWDDIEGCE